MSLSFLPLCRMISAFPVRGCRWAIVPGAPLPRAEWILVRFYSTEIGEARKLLTASPGEAILLSGVSQNANREIGVPGRVEGLTTSAKITQLTTLPPLAH
jgi:hypothetical protein